MGEEIPKTAAKPIGRPPGTGSGNKKLLRVFISPRQEFTLSALRSAMGLSESELVRRAIDMYTAQMIKNGEIEDTWQPAKVKLD